jgi:GTP pyrophosphokinase
VANVPGALGDLSMVIAKNHGNISNLKIINRAGDFYDLLIDIEVQNVKHLTEVIAALRASPVTHTIDRTRG